jgi:hypothetical protein
MKLVNYLIIVSLVFGCLSAQSQVKIGDNPTSINANSILELEASNKGFLLPRVALTSVDSSLPLSAFVYGMMVFNTATAGTGPSAVKPGLYYSDGARWVRLEVQSTLGTSWTIDGNTATSPNHFLGTTDNRPLILKTNSNEALRITPDGKVGIGTATPTAALDVNGNLKVGDVQSGSVADSILVLGNSDKVVKRVSANTFVKGMQKQLDIVATNGQQIFNTPVAIVDERKISLYRNGVMIGFTVAGANAIKAEIACYSGDEIRIVQLQ